MRLETTAPALAALLLAGCARATPAPAAPPGPPPAATAPAEAAPTAAEPTSPEGLLPGIPLDGLTPAQRQVVADWARDEFCYCGCPHTVSQCLLHHGGCHHSKRMARLAVRLAGLGMSRDELTRAITDYYSSFDASKRAALDVAHFGPPFGDPAAPITLVEFSDFTCPFCQLLRPQLERFVSERRARVKLVYKPFPIEAHEHAFDAAQAGEWARDQGIFWQMYDVLFANPHALSPPELAGYANDLGKSGADLTAALDGGRYREKVLGAQAEARAAGLTGTPTLFLDGRRLVLPDTSDWMLEFTLQDEEEWVANRGWARDAAP